MVNDLKRLNFFILMISLIISLNCGASILESSSEFQVNSPNYNVNLKDINLKIYNNFLINTYKEVVFDNVSRAFIRGDFVCQNASKIIVKNNSNIYIRGAFIANPDIEIEVEEGSSLIYR